MSNILPLKQIKSLPHTSGFTIENYINSGFWKDVWKAKRNSDHSTWALKFLNRTDVAYEQSKQRNLSEKEIWIKEGLYGNTTAFTNLAFHYVDVADDGTPFVAEEYVDRFLSDYIAEGSVNTKEILHITQGIAAGLRDLHTHIMRQSGDIVNNTLEQKIGVIHGDLKKDNIGYTTQKIVKITDFGNATGGSHGRDNVGYLYSRAPENFSEAPIMASDVYSAGTILYEMLAGKKLFKEEFGNTPTHAKTFIHENYARKKWNRLIDKKTSGMPKYFKKLLRSALYHHTDRLKDGAELLTAVEHANQQYEESRSSNRIKRYGLRTAIALPLLSLATFFAVESGAKNEKLIQLTLANDLSRRWGIVHNYFINHATTDETIIDTQAIDGYIDFFNGDRKSAAFAYVFPDQAARAYALSDGAKDFDTLKKYVPKDFDHIALIDYVDYNYYDNWMITGRSEVVREAIKKFTGKVADFKKTYQDSVAREEQLQKKMYDTEQSIKRSLKLIGK